MDEKLSRYFRGEMSRRDSQEIDEWILEDKKHLETARQACRLEMGLLLSEAGRKVNAADALSMMEHKMKRMAFRRFLHGLRNTAAALCIPLLILSAFLVWHYRDDGPVEMITVQTATGMVTSIVLKDGTKVSLNSNSSLTYPYHFRGGTREITLVGEACFEVAKDPSLPFIVHTKDVEIQVKGTTFDVEAYEGKYDETRVALASGSLEVSCSDSEGKQYRTTLVPGEQFSYNGTSHDISLSTRDVSCVMAWADGRIVLDHTPFTDAMHLIENRYNVEFLIRDDSLMKKTFTGTFVRQRLEVILQSFEKTANVKFDYLSPCTDSNTISDRQKIAVYQTTH